jgi:hypothetical protein
LAAAIDARQTSIVQALMTRPDANVNAVTEAIGASVFQSLSSIANIVAIVIIINISITIW